MGGWTHNPQNINKIHFLCVYVDILDLDLKSWSSGAAPLMEIMSHL